MANLTIVVDDQLLQAARLRALQQGTSVNEICREAIARFARHDDKSDEHLAQLRVLARKMRRGAGPAWPGRDALYAEAPPVKVP